MSTAWAIKDIPPIAPHLSEHSDISSTTLGILVARGVSSPEAIERFLNGKLTDLSDPYLLPGMDAACRRIFQAIRENELIMLHGDYDVDGVTSAAIMSQVLRELRGRFIPYIPERKSGYGFNATGVRFAKEQGAKVIVTLDCGITSCEEIAAAKRSGMSTVVVDHHQIPQAGAPRDACAVVNPWLNPEVCESFLELSAAGLAFKLASALLGETAHRWVDIAAVGTVADVSPLVGENRLIVKAGLRLLAARSHPGFDALLKSASHRSRHVSARHIAFIIAPRLNAGGRMDTGVEAYRLLVTEKPEEAKQLADSLERKNLDRRLTEKQMLKEAFEMCEREVNFNRDRVIVLWSENWHPGVIGIVAARLVDRYYRPAIVISLAEGRGKGSARSIRGFNMYQGLKAVSEHLLEFGGHEFAAGFTVEHSKLVSFRSAMNRYAEDALDPSHLLRPVDIDAELNFSHITTALAREISLLEPFGSGNPEPVFLTRNLRLKKAAKASGKFKQDLWVTNGQLVFKVITSSELAGKIKDGDVFDLAYTLGLDEREGETLITLAAKDIRWTS
ncbi:MAG: single-stranded-DNA-specific exonuclease RecJ [Candidatus Omnitrophica bacterium]|nr:single-stranded-DNA-specific exonuclease RecJ [Candidatus Omnitrophota bacterium]